MKKAEIDMSEVKEKVGEWVPANSLREGDIVWADGSRLRVGVSHGVMFGKLWTLTLFSVDGDCDGGQGVVQPASMFFRAVGPHVGITGIANQSFVQPNPNNPVKRQCTLGATDEE